MRLLIGVGSSWFVTSLFWLAFVACIDAPVDPPEPQSRVVASWDPRRCGDPHRVVLELEDEAGARVSTSATCALGGLAVNVAHFGVYRGRVYAWDRGEIRSVTPVVLAVDEPVLHWLIETPP
jgi:hypothetical protein